MHSELVNDERLTAIGLFAEAYEGLAARFAAQLAEHHLAPIEFEVLMRLARSPDGQLRMTDLSAQTTLTTSGVTRVIDRLNRDGLVCRRACPTVPGFDIPFTRPGCTRGTASRRSPACVKRSSRMVPITPTRAAPKPMATLRFMRHPQCREPRDSVP